MTDDQPAAFPSGSGWLVPVVIAFAVGFLLLTGIFYALDHLPASKAGSGTDKPAETLSVKNVLKSVAPILRERCAASAKASLSQRGVDTSQANIAATIDSYCTCAVDRSTEELSVRDLLAFKLNPSSEPAASKMKSIMQKCREAVR
jgi:hypothetical protein